MMSTNESRCKIRLIVKFIKKTWSRVTIHLENIIYTYQYYPITKIFEDLEFVTKLLGHTVR